jgi:LIM and SH3 domain protein 1
LQVKYHEDFEKAKGKVTQIADDPEILRIRANTKIIRYYNKVLQFNWRRACLLLFGGNNGVFVRSNVAYHGDLEKKAIMELKRENQENGVDAHGN